MKNKIVIVALLVVVLVLSIMQIRTNVQLDNIETNDTIIAEQEQVIESDFDNAVLANIYERKSVRAYTQQEVDRDILIELTRAAMAAPTAMNLQPWQFVIVDEKEVLEALGEELPYDNILNDAPAAIVVLGDMDITYYQSDSNVFWVQDCSAASQNLLLAAESLGLGAVWTGVYPGNEKINGVREVLNLDNKFVPLNVIVIGYPTGIEEPKDKWDQEKVMFNIQ